MSAVIEGTAPSSTKPIEDRMRTRKVKGEQVTEAQCRFCDQWQTADDQHFFPHRASGGLHLRSRCRGCEATYRSGVKDAIKAGEHEVKTRSGFELDDATEAAAKTFYESVLTNWAITRSEVIKETGLDASVVDKIRREMEGTLISSTHVNGEVPLTIQAFRDVNNEKGAKRAGMRDYAKWVKDVKAAAAAKVAAKAAKSAKTETPETEA